MDRYHPSTPQSRRAAQAAAAYRCQQSSSSSGGGSNSFYDEPNAQQQQYEQQPRGSPSRVYNPKTNQYTKQRAPTTNNSSAATADKLELMGRGLFNFLTANKLFNLLGLITLLWTVGNAYGRFKSHRDPELSETFVAMRRFRLGGNHAMELPTDHPEWTLGDFRHEFLCRHHFNKKTFSLYTLDQWEIIRKTFNEVVDPSFDFYKDPVPPTKGYSFQGIMGNVPPFYAGQTSRGSPGLFASRRIAKGELVHDGTQSDVTFPDAHSFRKFMFALPKKDIACDVTDFIWSQRVKEDGPKHIMAAFNIATYMNDAEEAEKEVNALPKDETSLKLYATKDIEKGEELLTHHERWDYDWESVGLGH